MSLREATSTRLGYVFQYPADLAVASLVAVVSYHAVTTYDPGSALRLLLAFPLVLFLPGYALVSVLFPTGARRHAASEGGTASGGLDVPERLGLALGLSIALVPFVVIGLSLSRVGLSAEPIAGTLAVIAVVVSQLGVVRRLRVPKADRFSFPAIGVLERVRSREGGTLAVASTVLLALAVAAMGIAMASAFVSPNAGGGFTELGLYTEDENGDLVAGEFPSAVAPGESIPFVVEVDNNEGEPREYTVVVQQQVLEGEEVVERTDLQTFGVETDADEAAQVDRAVAPTVEGETVRIAVLLYEEGAAEEPTRANADEDAFFWVDVAAEEVDEEAPVETTDEPDEEEPDEPTGDLEEPEEDGEFLETIQEGVGEGLDAVQDGIDTVGEDFDDDDEDDDEDDDDDDDEDEDDDDDE